MTKKVKKALPDVGITMLFDRVLVAPASKEDINKVSEAGIILPDTHIPNTLWGTVVAVGPGLLDQRGTTMPPTVRPGFIVYYEKRYGVELILDNILYHVMPEGFLAGFRRK